MPATGVTPAGYVVVPLATRLAQMQADVLATVDPQFDLSPGTPDGQILAIVANTAAAIDELGQIIYNAYNRDDVEGSGLDNLGDITGTPREGQTYSQVYAVLALAPGTYAASTWNETAGSLETGVLVANVVGSTQQQYANYAELTPTALSGTCTVTSGSAIVAFTNAQTLLAGSILVFGSQPSTVYTVSATITGEGNCLLTVPYSGTTTSGTTATPGTVALMQSVTIGATPTVNDNTLTQITAAVTGWSYVNNPPLDTASSSSSQTQVGQAEEADTPYALRQAADVAGEGGDTADALEAALNELGAAQVPPVSLTTTVIENRTNAVQDVEGLTLPPHTFAAVVWDAGTGWASTTAGQQAIAQVVWDNRPPGILPYGTTQILIDDPYLGEQLSAFSVPTPEPLFITMIVVPRPGVVLSNLAGSIQAALVAAAVAPTPSTGLPPVGQLAPGAPVIYSQLSAVVMGVPGVLDLQLMAFGFSAGPTNVLPLLLGAGQIATIDASTVATNVIVDQGAYP